MRNNTLIYPDSALSDEEAEKLMDKYNYLFENPNVVSLDYCKVKERKDISPRQKMLCIGVIKKDQGANLPEVAVYESSTKRIEVPVHVFEEGKIKALAPYEGGSLIKNEALTRYGTVGANTIFNGAYRLLTCAHVLTEFDDTNITNQRRVQIKQNPEDEAFQSIPVTIEGHAPAIIYNKPDHRNPQMADQDLAWARVTIAHGLPTVKEIGGVSGIRKPIEDETITLFGAESQYQLRNIPVVSTNARPCMEFKASDGSTKYVFFNKFGKLDITQGSVMPGDSGSAIIAEVDRAIVGILVCSGGPLFAYFCTL